MSEAEAAQLDAIRGDTQRAFNAQRLANVAGSHTAQLQRIENEITKMLGRIPGAKSNALAKAVWALLDGLMGDATANIYGYLNRAGLNPQFAAELMRGAGSVSKNPWARFAARPSQSTWQTFKDARGPFGVSAARAAMLPWQSGIARGLEGRR